MPPELNRETIIGPRGVTESSKTHAVDKVLELVQRLPLVLDHNKTLAT